MKTKWICVSLAVLFLFGCEGGGKVPEQTVLPEPTATTAPTVSPTPAETPPEPRIKLADFPKLDGSTATIPLAQALLQHMTGCSEEEAEARVRFSTTSASYHALWRKEADLLLAYEASPDTKESLDLEENFDVYPIGRDALVFVVNENNPVDSLTTAQIRDIYSGEITNWNQLGGIDAPIVAFQRPENSGSQTMMQKLVMGELPMMDVPNEYFMPGEMWGLISELASYNNAGNAIGYSVYYYAKNMYSLPGLKFLRVDGVAPTERSIADEEYPHINEFYAVTRKGADGYTKYLAEWLLSLEGQAFIASCGYVPVNGDALSVPETNISETPLWDEQYFAVLPGENMTRQVWDCYGRRIGFIAEYGLDIDLSYGMYTTEELAEKALFIDGKQLHFVSSSSTRVTTRYKNGFAQFDWKTGLLSMYDTEFNLRYTVQGKAPLEEHYPHTHRPAAFAVGEYDLLYYFDYESEKYWIPPQIRAKDGELVSYLRLKDNGALVVGIFADAYILGVTMVESKNEVVYSYSIYDSDGTALVRDVTPIVLAEHYYDDTNSWKRMLVSSGYVKDGKVWNGDFSVLEDFDRETYGWLLIEGWTYFPRDFYTVDGVSDGVQVWEDEWGTVAYRFTDGQLVVRRDGKVYRFHVDAEDAELWSINENFALIQKTLSPFSTKKPRVWVYELRFLQNGERWTFDESSPYSGAILNERYALVYTYQGKPRFGGKRGANQAIVDANGVICSIISADWGHLRALPFDLFLIKHGPYIGIIDIHGNWLVKTIAPNIADDIDYY